MERLPGDRAIGHVRYARRGTKHVKNTQPFAVDCAHGSIALANNGAITNGLHLRHKLEAEGSIFSSESDTEVLIHLIARSRQKTAVDRMAEALSKIEGAYSLVFLSAEELIAVRDPLGFRPLCLGQLDEGYVIASEPPAFELIGAQYIRDIEPGEMVVIDRVGLRSLRPFGDRVEPRRMCIFEYVYFARPDARLGGVGVYEARKAMGRALGREAPADVDIVVPVPDSGIAAALGYAEEIDRPFELGIIRSHYVGRTFIEPQQSIRNFGVRLKLHPIRELLAGKRVAVVDDSIVRGTTSRKIVRMLRDAGPPRSTSASARLRQNGPAFTESTRPIVRSSSPQTTPRKRSRATSSPTPSPICRWKGFAKRFRPMAAFATPVSRGIIRSKSGISTRRGDSFPLSAYDSVR